MKIFGFLSKTKPDNSGTTKISQSNEGAVIDGIVNESKPFGIKSYLHNFYQTPTDEERPGAWLLLPPPPAQRRGMLFCRFLTVLGILLLMCGATGIVIGYTWPHEPIEQSLYKIAIDIDEDGNYYLPPGSLAYLIKDPMKQWKIVGFILFAAGSGLMAIGLLVPALAQLLGGTRLAAFASEDGTPNEPPIRIYSSNSNTKGINPPKKAASNKISPTSGPVPVAEELSKVQPSEKKSMENSLTADDLLMSSDDTTPFIK
uniref:Neur_chan_memb domain-containing protein n=1 Tax=Parastrongyloides trichosuri TaxID=131310 RepID=A0A0N4ZXG4_PARTI